MEAADGAELVDMTKMKLVDSKDDILKRKAENVTSFDKDLSLLIQEMFDALYEFNGVGLAAPQVGISKKLLVIDSAGGKNPLSKYAMINPKITWRSASTNTMQESCLSIPGVVCDVERHLAIDVEYQGVNGQTRTSTFTNYLARVVQHEIDHLAGILITDRKASSNENSAKRIKGKNKSKAA